MELDHIFIKASRGAPEANALKRFGLVESESNIHVGQGTANRRFFFHNMMIELIWIEDLEEVQNDKTKPMKLFERLSSSSDKASPFGICFRPNKNSEMKAPFPSWKYNPIYLPSNLSIEVGSNIQLKEPLWFFISFGIRPDEAPEERMQHLEHKIPLKEVTSTKVTAKEGTDISEVARIINEKSNLEFEIGECDLLELEFDCGKENKFYDFRPDLPMIFKW